MHIKFSNYVNNKRKNIYLLKERNKVYFLTKNLKTKNKNKKLNSIKVEAFIIKKVKEFKNYELNLSKDAKIYLIFNISLLKLVDSNTLIQKLFRYEKQKEEEFKVERILKERKDQYLIK